MQINSITYDARSYKFREALFGTPRTFQHRQYADVSTGSLQLQMRLVISSCTARVRKVGERFMSIQTHIITVFASFEAPRGTHLRRHHARCAYACTTQTAHERAVGEIPSCSAIPRWAMNSAQFLREYAFYSFSVHARAQIPPRAIWVRGCVTRMVSLWMRNARARALDRTCYTFVNLRN